MDPRCAPAVLLSFITIDPDGTSGPRDRATTYESGVDARKQLPGSHNRRVGAVEKAIVAPPRRYAATKTALRSVAPHVAMVKPTHSRQCNDFSRQRWPRCDGPPVWRILAETQVATVLVVQVHNVTLILPNREKSVIGGIHGMASRH